MCGRFALGADPELVALVFYAKLVALPVRPSWNIAPTDPANIVYDDGGGRVIGPMRWGFDLSGSRKAFNARLETILDKWRFKRSAQWHRCLVPATGWYEWTKSEDGGRDPHFLTSPESDLIALGGLWEKDADDARFTIITRPALDGLQHLHDRMPLVLPSDKWDIWLNPDGSEVAGDESVKVATNRINFSYHRVSREVNNSLSEGPELVDSI